MILQKVVFTIAILQLVVYIYIVLQIVVIDYKLLKGEFMRIVVNVPDDLLSKLNKISDELNISRSVLISACCSSSLNVDYITIFLDCLKKLG